MNQKHLQRYAELLVKVGMVVQPGQEVVIVGERPTLDFAYMIAEAAYVSGQAKHVSIVLATPGVDRLHVLHAAEENLGFVPYAQAQIHEQLVPGGAVVRLEGPEDPDVWADLDSTRVSQLLVAKSKARPRFYGEGIGQSKVHWLVAGAATPGWAKKVFPDLSETEACEKLWELIFKLCRVDQDNFLQAWREHDERLHHRNSVLNGLGIDRLHFTGGGTDLYVTLSRLYRFLGGSKLSALGKAVFPNLPTEENFTSPDWRGTEGEVRATRPVLINGVVVEGLVVVFEQGRIKSFTASKGEAAFGALIDTDPGARQLGEIALVGIDSPIFQSGLMLHSILYDENAACHMAVGRAYHDALYGGQAMEEKELAGVGCNSSDVHVDIMISNETTNVTAITTKGEIPLISEGKWVI